MIPDYQNIMLPLLKFLGDGKSHEKSEAIIELGKYFKLSENEMNDILPNSKYGKKIFNNRVHWAQAQLKRGGLMEYLGKGSFKITDKGKSLLNENPQELTIAFLRKKFPEYDKTFRHSDDSIKFEIDDSIESLDKYFTPEELIDSNYSSIRKSLEQEILSKLKSVHPSFFERIVVELLVKMGYGGSIEEAGKATRYTNDEGIDGIIKEDKLGLDVIYIQAKRWEGNVSRPEIQKFVGALAGQRAKKGVFITTSNFSNEAVSYAAHMDTKIVLINGEQLAQYMIDYNLGVSVQNVYEIKRIDSDYFDEE